MKYENIIEGKFIERPNRFVAVCIIDGKEQRVHVKNTGRCKELLVKGANVWLEDYEGRMGKRKMRYSLIAVEKETGKKDGKLLINMDSQAPNKVAGEALLEGKIKIPGMEKLILVKGEQTYGNSRLDFYIEDCNENKGFVEVKGVTLEEENIAYFPDAPTARGVKHIEELIKARKEGYCACVLFIVQMEGMKEFRPNYKTHPAFGEALKKAKVQGVEILAVGCNVAAKELSVNCEIRVRL